MMPISSDDLTSSNNGPIPLEITMGHENETKFELSFFLADGTDCCVHKFSENDFMPKTDYFAHTLCSSCRIEDALILSSSDELGREQQTLYGDECSYSSLDEFGRETTMSLEEEPEAERRKSRCAYINDLLKDDLRLFYKDVERLGQSEISREGDSEDNESSHSSHLGASLEEENTTIGSAYINDLLKDNLKLFHQDVARWKPTPMDDWAVQCLTSFQESLDEEKDDDDGDDAASCSSFSSSSYYEEIPPLVDE